MKELRNTEQKQDTVLIGSDCKTLILMLRLLSESSLSPLWLLSDWLIAWRFEPKRWRTKTWWMDTDGQGLWLLELLLTLPRIDLSNILKNGTNEKQHRYAPHPECSNPCRVMAVTIFNKYKAMRNGTMEIKILLPRIVNVTKDVFVKTFISLGNRK